MSENEVQTDLQSICTFLSKNGFQTLLQPSEPPQIPAQVLVYLE